MYRVLFLIGICCTCRLPAQTLGGNAVFNFLAQPNTAQVSGLGGVNVSAISNDVGMAFQNPALLRINMHQQVNTSFNAFVAGIKNYSLTTAYHAEAIQTNFAIGVSSGLGALHLTSR